MARQALEFTLRLWTGVWMWFYVLVIIPLDVGIVFSFVVILRGVANL